MYHRFVTNQLKVHPENTGMLSYLTGLWVRKDLEDDDPRLGEKADKEVGEFIVWFNHHLMTPKNPNKIKGLYWFKDSIKMVDKSKELMKWANYNNIPCSHIVADDLGEIEFEDKYQVIAKLKRRTKYKIVE